MVATAALLALLTLGAAPSGEDREQQRQRLAEAEEGEAFLTEWLTGADVYSYFGEFHEAFPGSPHRSDSQAYEAEAHCIAAREGLPAERLAKLARAAIDRAEAPWTRPVPRSRAIYVMGCLGRAEAVGPLVGMIEDPEPRCERLRSIYPDQRPMPCGPLAVQALGWFGPKPHRSVYIVFGGRPLRLHAPGSPSALATAALVELFDRQKGEGEGAALREAALDALHFHEGPAVEALAERLAKESTDLDMELAWFLRSLPEPKAAKLLAARAESGGARSRAEALEALVRLGNEAAVPALKSALYSGIPELVDRADYALADWTEEDSAHGRIHERCEEEVGKALMAAARRAGKKVESPWDLPLDDRMEEERKCSDREEEKLGSEGVLKRWEDQYGKGLERLPTRR